MHAPCVGQPAAATVPCFRAARRCARRRAAAPCAQSQAAPAAVSSSVAERRGGRAPAGGAPLKHFVHIDDLTQAQLYDVLGRAAELKARYRAGDVSFQPLRGMSMAMIFAKPSLRTRVSFETVRPGGRRTPGASAPLRLARR
jgi:ornithine carbamoyltransferase